MERCDYKKPAGWYCTREQYHEGPCAAIPLAPEPPHEILERNNAEWRYQLDLLLKYHRIRPDDFENVPGPTFLLFFEPLDRQMSMRRVEITVSQWNNIVDFIRDIQKLSREE